MLTSGSPVVIGLNSILTIVLLAAALGKLRDRRAFVYYLRPVGVRNAHVVSTVVPLLEVSGAALLAIASADAAAQTAASLAVAAFLVSATAGYAALLAAGQSATCMCFGFHSPAVPTLEPSVRPALAVLRNVLLVEASLMAAGLPSAALLAAGSAAAGAVALGLAISIVRTHRVVLSTQRS